MCGMLLKNIIIVMKEQHCSCRKSKLYFIIIANPTLKNSLLQLELRDYIMVKPILSGCKIQRDAGKIASVTMLKVLPVVTNLGLYG